MVLRGDRHYLDGKRAMRKFHAIKINTFCDYNFPTIKLLLGARTSSARFHNIYCAIVKTEDTCLHLIDIRPNVKKLALNYQTVPLYASFVSIF